MLLTPALALANCDRDFGPQETKDMMASKLLCSDFCFAKRLKDGLDRGGEPCEANCKSGRTTNKGFRKRCVENSNVGSKEPCNSATGCLENSADVNDKGAKNSEDIAKTAGENATSSADARNQQLDAANNRLQDIKSDLDARGAPPSEYNAWKNDAQLVQSAMSSIENGKPIPTGMYEQANDPQIQRDLKVVTALDDTSHYYQENQSFYSQQAQQLAQVAKQSETRGQNLGSLKESPTAEINSKPGEEAKRQIALAEKAEQSGEKTQTSKPIAESKLREVDSIAAKLEQSLAQISSKALRDALRKKLLARLKNNPTAGALADAEKEISEIAAKENLPTGAQAAAEELLSSALEGGGRSISSVDLDEGARKLREELLQAQDEQAGITHLDPRTLFQRVTDFLKICQEKKCVL